MTAPPRIALALAAATFATAALAEEITVSHGISAFGELKYPADFPHFDYVNPDAPQGGTMSFRGQLASRTFDSLNLFILRGEPAQGLELLYDTLLVRAYDEPDAVYGQIAETIEYPEDRSWVIFNLRPEARFHDGTQITADDVKFTFDTLKVDGLPFYQIQLADLESVTVLSPTKVRVDFVEGARTRDLISDIGQIEILPEHFYEEIDFTRSSLIEPLGSGQYKVFKTDPGRSITYCKIDDYWGEDLPVNRGEDNFDCVRYEYFADSTAAFEALKSGEYLFHEEVFSALWATGYDFPALDRGWVIRDVVSDGRPSGAQGFWFNLRREINQDPRVRQAIGMMFNFEWSNETLFYGLYGRTDSFFENSDLEASGMLEGAELALLEPFRDQLPPEVFTEPAFVPNVSSTRQIDRRAVAEASALLDAAGWTVGGDGRRVNAAGEPLEMAFVYDGPAFERIILPFISNLERLGVTMSNDLIDPAQMQERQEVFDFDITVARLVPPVTPSASGLRSIYGSASANAQGSLNLTGQADPVVDALIDAAGDAKSRAELVTALRALDRVMRAKHLWVPNWTKGQHWLAYWDVFGRPDAKPAYVRGDRYWWWDEEKYQALKAEGALR
ncbi:extracellular solute-binding protein [Ovoidimarina sediminis]|uniref:extracellular solute-binding protein n=1 Tax=Ovoidimarina sediminis TaxID=3079856 RepID=UPI0029145B45|nr:extracellular solute-binding protein [Rhodophyticola sp. MJ-SS7]MDU8946077.1 extracellular solute-binding protein [Rhodophyticola sp. MJ-SS7]